MSADNYVVVLDRDLNFCRLFRSDSEDMPSGEVLWSGNGLRHGYDAMIRLNKERKPVVAYYICLRIKGTRKQYSIKREAPAEGYEVIFIKNDYQQALQELKTLKAKAEQEHQHTLGIMKRVGIRSKRIPKFTDTDLRYIDWLNETGKMAA